MNQRLFGLLIASTSAALIAQPATWALSDLSINGIAKQITVRISNGMTTGSGVLIKHEGSSYLILTAAHVLAGQESLQVMTNDGHTYSLEPNSIQIHKRADLATARFLSNNDYPVANISQSSQVQEGEPIHVAGYPAKTVAINESIYSFSSGKLLANSTPLLREGYGLVYSSQTLAGMSGGPILNSEGQLVGIHGRADATIGTQDETLNPDIYVKSGANLGVPIQLAFDLVPKTELTYVKSVNQTLIHDLWLQANFYRRQNNNVAAITTLEQIIRLNPNYIDAYHERADIYLTLGQPLSALLDLNQVVQLDPSLGEGYYNLALAYSRSGSPQEAIANFKKAASIFQEKGQTDKYKATQAELKRFRP